MLLTKLSYCISFLLLRPIKDLCPIVVGGYSHWLFSHLIHQSEIKCVKSNMSVLKATLDLCEIPGQAVFSCEAVVYLFMTLFFFQLSVIPLLEPI